MRVTTSVNVGTGSGILMPAKLTTTRLNLFFQSKTRGGRSLDTLTLERRPRAEPYAHPVCANGLGDRADDLKHEPRAIPHRAAIRVRPAIRVRLQELVHEIPVRPVD